MVESLENHKTAVQLHFAQVHTKLGEQDESIQRQFDNHFERVQKLHLVIEGISEDRSQYDLQQMEKTIQDQIQPLQKAIHEHAQLLRSMRDGSVHTAHLELAHSRKATDSIDFAHFARILNEHRVDVESRLANLHGSLRERQPDVVVDLQQVQRWIEDHAADMRSLFGSHSEHGRKQHVRFESQPSSPDSHSQSQILQAIRELKTAFDFRPLQKAIQDQRSEMELSLAQVNKGIKDIALHGMNASPISHTAGDSRSAFDSHSLEKSIEAQIRPMQKAIQELI